MLALLGGRVDVRYVRKELLLQIIALKGKPTTIDQLAETLQCGKRTIIRHREGLKKQGFIDWQPAPGSPVGTYYEVNPDALVFLEEC